MSISRIFSYTIRYLYLYKRSMPRLMEIFYWPLLDLLLWGFVGLYLREYRTALPNFITFFLGALILWDILFRSQQGISVSFLEDVWSRNLLNVFVSPLSPGEYLASLLVLSMIKLLLAASVMSALAWFLYSFNIFTLGVPLIPLALNLMIMGWSIGIVTTALILRFGAQAEVLAWAVALLFQPVSAVFYPLSVLPGWMRAVAEFTPSAHVFEGMRLVLNEEGFPARELLLAAALNAAYILASVLFFIWNLRVVKRKGLLVKVGE